MNFKYTHIYILIFIIFVIYFCVFKLGKEFPKGKNDDGFMLFGLKFPFNEFNIFELDSILFNIFFASSEILIPDNISRTLLKSIEISSCETFLNEFS